MTSWMQERDRLMAQTLAFVQGVNGAQPEVDTPPIETVSVAPQPAVAESLRQVSQSGGFGADAIQPQPTTLQSITPQPATPQPTAPTVEIAAVPVDQSERFEAIAASAAAILSQSASPSPSRPKPMPSPIQADPAQPISTAQRQIPLTAGSEREDILKRVAAFRARQSQLSRERESYYEDVYAKIQRSLGSGDKDKAQP